VKYRSRTDIIAMILQAAMNGATKTRIMYGAYLSYAQVKEYLSFLIGKDLIRYEEGSGVYKLTQRGVQLLHVYEDISDMITVNDQKNIPSSVS
jgi:predicted transcriptional regulator